MALLMTVKDGRGFEAKDAYHRVEAVRLISKNKMAFQLRSYKDDSGLPAFGDQSFECPYDISGTNPIHQAYDHLKQRPDFEVAQDA